MGEVGKLFAALKERAIGEMVIVGAMSRPDFADLRLDWGAVKRAGELAQLFRRGDNGLLVGLAAIIEREGVRIVGAHEVAPRLVAPVGPFGARDVSPDDEADIAFGTGLARGALALRRRAGRRRRRRPGARDRSGRGNRRDAGPRRGACAPAGACGARGRPAFSSRRPSAGRICVSTCRRSVPDTIRGAARAQLRGVAIAAGRVLVVERERCAREADAAGLFVYGFRS